MDAGPHRDTYDPPRLRDLGSVHDLTQGGLFGNTSDGLSVSMKFSAGVVINGS